MPDLTWRKSSHSDSGVQVRFTDDSHVLVANSRDTGGLPLAFTLAEWEAFLAGVRAGEFDQRRPPTTRPPEEDVSA